MQSAVRKRSIVITGHKTSVSLEDAFWSRLKEIASQRGQTISEVVGSVDVARTHTNLSSALRLFVLDHCPLQPLSVGAHVAASAASGAVAHRAD